MFYLWSYLEKEEINEDRSKAIPVHFPWNIEKRGQMELHRDSEQLQRVQRQSRWSRRIRLGLVGLQLKKQVFTKLGPML